MLLRSDSPPPGADRQKPHSGKLTTPLHISLCRRTLLVAAALFFQLLVLFSTRPLATPRLNTQPSGAGNATCHHGKIFVYDLPPEFNSALIAACDGLNPWSSRCTALSNSGLGPPAADLAGVVPASLLPSWFSTDQFAAELLFHRRLLAHRCRTLNPSSASALFMPFYVGLAVSKHLWSPNATSADRDRLCANFLRWISSQDSWRRSYGWDHVIVLGRITWDFRRSRDGEWGSSFLHMGGMENVTRLVIERDPWDELDLGIPYPTGFHPRSFAEIRSWQRFVLNQTRPTLFSFAGAARAGFRDDFRGLLLKDCREAGSACHAVDCGHRRCSNRSAETVSLFMGSRFCLQPRGDSHTRRSMFDCMVAGAIPVLFWNRTAYTQYGMYLPPGEEWSVFIDNRKVKSGAVSIRSVLEGIGEEGARRLRERVVELIPRLVYARVGLGEGMRDAVDVAVDGVLKQFRDRRRPLGS